MANRSTRMLTAGLKLFGGGNTPAYSLEYLSGAGDRKPGSSETIVMPYIELGRASSCGIRFMDSLTVSRKHCAIEVKEKETFLVNLSETNPTLINGRPVNKKYFLNSGDEIQLSVEGPKLRYTTTSSGTKTMSYTQKMGLVMQQAIRPYKTAVVSVALLFFMAIGILAFFLFRTTTELQRYEVITQAQADSIASVNKRNGELASTFSEYKRNIQKDIKKQKEVLQNEIEKQKQEFTKTEQKLDAEIQRLRKQSNVSDAEILEALNPYVLAIFWEKVSVNFNGNIEEQSAGGECMCTGFLLEGGDFVTARHCIDAILTESMDLNMIDNNGGEVVLHFRAVSFDGNIDFRFTNKDLQADYSKDEKVLNNVGGVDVVVRIPDYFTGADWAFKKTSFTMGLSFDKSGSSNLKQGEELIVLGYSYGTQFRTSGSMQPYYSTAKTTLTGVHNGTIHVTDATFDGGNSGGPVFVKKDGIAQVVGIVTGKFRKPEADGDVMVDANVQIITPIANIR
ncbi:MAG: FHA domain-containing protein [Cyclobacteriaceae bacterium]|nr:FHA domain-containing protein [Cyclobacteriaceae bacterium]